MEMGPDIAESASIMVLLPPHPEGANDPPPIPSFAEKPFSVHKFILSLFHAPYQKVLVEPDDSSSDIAQSSFTVCLEKKNQS